MGYLSWPAGIAKGEIESIAALDDEVCWQ